MVRIQAGRLRCTLDLYYVTEGSGDPVHIGIPRGTYVPTFRPHSDVVQPGEPIPAEEPVSPPAGPKTGPAIEADMPAALSVETSIAVLPFVNLSLDEDDFCLADGMTEELVIALTRFADLRVVGPLNKLRGQQIGPAKLAGTMGFASSYRGRSAGAGHSFASHPP